ncbi:MAG: dihydroorotate dehydrogenase [Actinobacteria bacterium]|nr:dihydroorotate dehydrogenase [Actinomycetota bacterium]
MTRGPDVDLTTSVGSLSFVNPVMTASGTAGHGVELAPWLDLSSLGAVVVKSLRVEPWSGNPAPRVHETPAGMLNSVGLQGPGIEAWMCDSLPALVASGARVVVSIWGSTVDDYARAAALLAEAPPAVVAVEVNVSCPNVEDRRRMFAHSSMATEEALSATASCRRPRWAKLSPNVGDLVPIAEAAQRGGAEAVTLINTVMAMAIDPGTRRYRLGSAGAGGGLSGPAIRPVAVRAVHDVHAALPGLPIIGVGGVASGDDAVELLLAGASAIQVGTATFADPRACRRVIEGIETWCRRHGVAGVKELIGAVHRDRGERP